MRGGSGLYYGSVISNVTFSQQSFGNRIIVNSFANDNQPGWFLNPDAQLHGRADRERRRAAGAARHRARLRVPQ